MSGETCDEMRLLIQADMDGELSPAEAAKAAAHVVHCESCAAFRGDVAALSARLQALPREPLPKTLEAAILARVAKERSKPAPPWRLARVVPGLPAFGGGFALAAVLAFFVLPPIASRDDPAGGLTSALVSAHIRALQPGHLMDVASSDQHTVKPWFDGKLPFAPPVKDLKAQGFPLEGGRLDYVAGHLAAALVYRHGAHEINLFVWPETGTAPAPGGAKDGYNFEHWTADGMVFWAVSDLNAVEIADFVARWRAL